MANQHFQLLVHAGAPSTRQDDGRYKSQAEAYLGLPCRRERRGQHASREVDQPEVSEVDSDALRNRNMEPTTDATLADMFVYLEDTQLAYSALESQLRSSAGSKVRQTPTPTHPKSSKNPAKGTSSIKQALGVSQSSYLVSPQLARSKQGKKTQHTEHVQKLPRLVRKPNTISPVAHQDHQRSDGSDKENADQTMLESAESTSELPTSYSLSEGASARSGERPSLPQKSASDPGLLAAGLAESAAKFVPPARGLDPSELPVKVPQEQRIAKASEVQVSSKRPQTSAAISDSGLARLQGLSSEIFPPGPVTSNTPFQTHITPALQHLVQVSAVAAAFNPIFQTRELEHSERGHWLIQCQHWPVAEQVAFWESLVNSIENTGWGVWCTRGPDHQMQNALRDRNESREASASAVRGQSFQSVRVWCWGEVVKHMYLLLYVASSSKVRKLGLRWIDSEGRVVVQMR